MSPRGLFPVVASLCFLVAAASAQAATKHVFFQQSARVAPRFLDQIGFIPIAGSLLSNPNGKISLVPVYTNRS